MATSSESLASPSSRHVAAEGTGLWARALTPTFSDILFISLMAWLFAAGNSGWTGLLVDGDTGWHIRTGEWVLEHGRVPTEDLFSFSKAGQRWFAWEWLTDVLYAFLFRFSGLKGIVLVSGLGIALVALLTFRQMIWRGSNVFAALLVSLFGVGASSVHFLARPHVFTLLFLAISMWVLERDRRTPSWHVWLLIPLTALWTNMHGGFMALIACLGLLAAGSAVEGWLDASGGPQRWAALRRYGFLAAACSAATLVNPYGYQLHLHVVAYLRSEWIKKVVQEFQSPAFRSENMLQFEALMLVGLLAAAYLLVRRRVTDALWILFWVHQSLNSVRHIPVFVVVAAPLIAAEVSRWWERWTAGRPRQSLLSILDSLARDMGSSFQRSSAWVLLPVLVLVPMGAPIKWPKNFPDVKFPVRIVEKYRERMISERIFTADQWADYLIFRSYPQQKVFFDGRSDFYGPEIGEQYIRLVQGHHEWERILERHRFQLVLSPAEWPLVSLLKKRPDWRILEDDGKAVLFARISGSADALSRPTYPEKATGRTNEKL
jgi:hypothetical protein